MEIDPEPAARQMREIDRERLQIEPGDERDASDRQAAGFPGGRAAQVGKRLAQKRRG